MKAFRRSLVALGVAATLPVMLLAAVAVFYLLRLERAQLRSATLVQAEQIVQLADARASRDLAVLEVLSASVCGACDDFVQTTRRVLANNADWARVTVFDARSGRSLQNIDASQAYDGPSSLQHAEMVGLVAATNTARIGPVERIPEPVLWIYTPVDEKGELRYVLGAAIRTDVFQTILTAVVPHTVTAALVDSRGEFVARSIDHERYVGAPASSSMQEAIGNAPSGFYVARSSDGQEHHSAYHTSERFGWSAHLALPARLIKVPSTWSVAVAALAGLGAVLLAGILVILVLRDMAERRRTEEAIRQAQKMEAVGQLTGGIAHDFNNLLTAIIGNLDLIKARTKENERLQRLAVNALDAARRGAKLAGQLLAFSRTQRMKMRRIDLRQLLSGMSGLLAQSVGPSVKVEIDIHPEARTVVSDANQLELALLNLAVNARDAMKGSGTLSIRARPVRDVDPSLPPDDYVELAVSDTGMGMSEEVRARAIEPFFTTKPAGEGTGLGLSQVYGVVRESGGTLLIDSEPGRGTTIRLILRSGSDLADSPLTQPHATQPIQTSGAESQIRVLVVDDDRLVRRFMAESLRSLGYQVTEAADGNAALEQLRTDAYDLLIVDFAMPGMNGVEVARVGRELRPSLRTLIVSGYADTNALENAIGAQPQLRKPFNVAELQAAVKNLLESEHR